jgi:hypothetical protein
LAFPIEKSGAFLARSGCTDLKSMQAAFVHGIRRAAMIAAAMELAADRRPQRTLTSGVVGKYGALAPTFGAHASPHPISSMEAHATPPPSPKKNLSLRAARAKQVS